MTPIERVIAIARAEIGYLEKASNAQLDSKTANAGDKNWTKYARDLDVLKVYNGPKNGYAWCDMFVDWCFIKAFGLELALKMTGQKLGGYGAGCTESVNYYKAMGRFYKSGPQPGDQIFFTQNNGQSFYHTGLVERVQDGKVFTIEGNTSSAAGVVENGGAVRDKSYSLSYNRIGGYGRPNYSLIQEDEDMDINTMLSQMTDKQAYDLLVKAQRHASTLPEPHWSQKEGHWQRAIDGGIINGGSPEGLLKRDEFVAVLGRKGLL